MELWDQALELDLAGKYTEAEKIFDQLLTQNPLNPGLLATYGTMCLRMKKTGLGIALMENALKLMGGKNSDVLCNLGIGYKDSGQPEKALKYLDEAIKGDPQPMALVSHAGYLLESARQDEAIANCRKALRMNPDIDMAHWNMSLMLLSQGKWGEGWDEHEYGLKPGGLRANRNIGFIPDWDGFPGKKVIVYGEQGIGDEIMFASMLPDVLKTNDIIIESHERLVKLFEHSFPGIKVYGTREEPEPQWPANETADARIAIGSLGKFYRRNKESFPGTPYLKAEPLLRGPKFRVGISWTGGYKQSRVAKRTAPLAFWKSILNVPDIEFVSLQYTDCQEEIDVQNALGYDIKTYDFVTDRNSDYYKTAQLVKSCDLVISVCTSVIHLAGALGVPCWCMTPKYPAWRYQNEGRMPWYRSVRLYRQAVAGEWKPVIQRVGYDLAQLVNEKRMVA